MHRGRSHTVNLKPDIKSIQSTYADMYYGMYMQGMWGVTVGYDMGSFAINTMMYEVATWQTENDCGDLCTESRQ